ncbi:MAG TPA: disulfide bond formation protein B [Eoetvoesiella sp.]
MPRQTTALLHLIALLCLGAVGIALVSQYLFNMRPCAWCVFQRLIYLAIALSCWLAILFKHLPSARRVFTLLATLLSAGGIAAAWYQYNVAAKMFSCEQTFADQFMVKSGLDANVSWLFGIYATCMDAKVHVLGIEYALWSLLLFALLGLLSLLALFRR